MSFNTKEIVFTLCEKVNKEADEPILKDLVDDTKAVLATMIESQSKI